MQPTAPSSPSIALPSPLAEDAGARTLRAKVARGSLWALAGHGGSQILRLGGNLVLWRLLYAEAFGLMAIVNVILLGLTMFSDVGIGPSIIQNERGEDPDYLNTAWTIQALRGFALFAVAAVAAGPIARFYQQPELASLLPVVGLGSVIAGFNSTKLFTATRQISLGRLTAIDLLAQAASLAAMTAWALASRSIWALVVGGLVYNLLRFTLSHALLPGIQNRFAWDKRSAHVLLHFGRWIFISTLLTFVVMQADRLVFGKLVPMSVLGVYSIAAIWSTFPSQIQGHVFQSVVFPMLSRLHNEGADVAAAYRRVRFPWLAAAGWLAACLVAGGPTLVRFLYDERAAAAGPMVQILGAGTWFLALEISNGSALLAQGKPQWVAASSAAKLGGMVVLIPLGMALGGFLGAVTGFAASEVLRYLVSLTGATRAKLGGFPQDLRLTLAVAATALVGMTARAAFHRGVTLLESSPRLDALAEGAAIFAVVSALWGALFMAYRRRARLAEAAA